MYIKMYEAERVFNMPFLMEFLSACEQGSFLDLLRSRCIYGCGYWDVYNNLWLRNGENNGILFIQKLIIEQTKYELFTDEENMPYLRIDEEYQKLLLTYLTYRYGQNGTFLFWSEDIPLGELIEGGGYELVIAYRVASINEIGIWSCYGNRAVIEEQLEDLNYLSYGDYPSLVLNKDVEFDMSLGVGHQIAFPTGLSQYRDGFHLNFTVQFPAALGMIRVWRLLEFSRGEGTFRG